MKKINLAEYYSKEHSKDFFDAAKDVIYHTEITNFIENFKELSTRKFTEERSFPDITHNIRILVSDVHEFNMFLIRLAIGLEMALKGLYLLNGFNIFYIKGNGLIKNMNFTSELYFEKTLPLNFFKENLLKIDPELDKYRSMIEFFQDARNEFIHFAKNEYTYSNKKVVSNIMLLDNFMKIILPFEIKNESNREN